jgi:hypothetical protein
VLAGDPAADWDQVKSFQDVLNLIHHDASIASLMEKEVLSKHRKAQLTVQVAYGVRRFQST